MSILKINIWILILTESTFVRIFDSVFRNFGIDKQLRRMYNTYRNKFSDFFVKG